MLAGLPPIFGTSARALTAGQWTAAATPPRTLRPEVPLHVERALARALAKDPADRFASAAAFVAALQGEGPAGGAGGSAARCSALLPFGYASPDPATEYMSDGITDALISALPCVDG